MDSSDRSPPITDSAAPASRPLALVTGGARRLGRAIALGLAQAGWDLAVHYRSRGPELVETLAELAALGARAHAFEADLVDEAAADGLMAAVIDRMGLPRCLINSAAQFQEDRPESFSWACLQAQLGPNLAAPLRLAQQLYQATPPTERGVVVHVLDQKLAALNPDFFSYTLTKAALAAALPMQAMAFAPRLRVVAVSPGLTLPSHLQSAEQFERHHRTSALLDASSRPQDIVAAVLALLANPAITGQNLVVDGGQHLRRLERDVSYLP